MNSRVSRKDFINIVKKFLLDEKVCNDDICQDTNNLIKTFNEKYKDDFKFKIYFDKPLNGNPYYVKNDGLRNCAKLIQELSLLKISAIESENSKCVINSIYEQVCKPGEVSDTDYENKCTYVKNICCELELNSLFDSLTKNNIFVLNFKGGNRNTIPYECEIDILVKMYKDMDINSIILPIENLVAKYGAKFIHEGGL